MSNFLKPRDARLGPPDGPVTFRPVRAGEIETAVDLILSGGAGAGNAHEQAVAEFLAFAKQRQMDLNLFWVAEQAGKLALAVLPVLSPGRTMLLLAPVAVPLTLAGAQEMLVSLVDRVCQAGTGAGVHLAQALVEPQHEFLKTVFTKAGFGTMAELLYLHMVVRPEAQPVVFGNGWQCHTYSPQMHALFARAILESYHESLDCPRLNGLRGIDDIIAGHQSAGEFDPNLWFVVSEPGEGGQAPRPLAVLLLSAAPRAEAMELVYLGLTPAARGRRTEGRQKVSEILMHHALACCAKMKLTHFTCAVDAANVPALKLYYRLGMQRTATRMALLRDLRKG